MNESVEANGSAVEIADGGPKIQPGALQEVSAIIVSSEAVLLSACREPVQARNSMTLLPVDGNVVQNQVVDDDHVKGGVPPSTTDHHVPGKADALPRQQGSAEDGEALETPNRDRTSDARQDEGNDTQHVEGEELEHTADGAVGGSSCTIGAATVVLAESPSGSRPFEAVRTHGRKEDSAVGRQLADDGPSQSRSTVGEQDRVTSEPPPADASKGIAYIHTAREDLEHSDTHNEEPPDKISPPTEEKLSGCSAAIVVGVHVDGGSEPSTGINSADRNMAKAGVLTIALEVQGVATSQQPPDDAEQESQLVNGGSEALVACTEEEGVSNVEARRTIASHKEASTTTPPSPEKVYDGDKPDPTEEEVFFLCQSFTEAKPGFVFKLGDRGLGFYVDGYVDRPTKEKCKTSHPPWNAGPGNDAIRRAPMGPVPKPFKRIPTRGASEEAKAAEESDTRPFMARMVAQRNSRGFQSTLFKREYTLDAHILSLLENFSDPTFFKKRHGYNVHGQMLGRDGKMIVKVTPEKTEEEKAKLSWYRKVYEDRLGKHLPSKRLGDSIEARREAYAYSRHFTAELNEREDELHNGLTKALKGQTKLEFITEDYQYPGAYDTDGKVILEKGVPISNELHQTEEQKERACTYRFKAIQRFRAAHDDIIKAVSKKEKALQKVLKKTDPTILLEIAEETVQSSGMGIYRRKKKTSQEVDPAEGRLTTVQRTDSPEQLRDKFAHTLKGQMKAKDKALLKEVAALDEGDAEQMIFNLTRDVEVLPGSWRQDPGALKQMQAHRKHLLAEIEADRRKVFCPWRPGGKHIAHEPWQPFIPRNHQPPVRSSSEGKASTDNANTTDAVAQKYIGHGPTRGSGSEKEKEGRRPHTAPSYRRKDFIDTISPRARRVLAAQLPGTPLHSAFSTYSTDPFPLEPTHRPNRQSGPVRTEYDAGVVSSARSHASRFDKPFQMSGSIEQGRQQRAWAEISHAPARAQTVPGGNIKRPHSATIKTPRQARVPPRRPSTAAGTRNPASEQSDGTAAAETVAGRGTSPSAGIGQQQEHDNGGKSLDLHVQSGPGVTVLWARLCRPSSDLVYKHSAWPSRPGAPDDPHRSRRRVRPSRKAATDAVSQTQAPPTDAEHEGGMPTRPVNTATVDPEGDREEHTGQSDCKARDGSLLSNLEGDLFASNWKRVNQRRRVFRGYAERSRMARTWDPGSIFHSEGAGRRHVADPKVSKKDWNGRKTWDGAMFPRGFCGPGSSNLQKRHRRNRPSLDAHHPVEMDWNEVDTRRFHDAADEVQAALERRLFPVVTNDETDHLAECFREAHELVDSVGVLLECPENERERFSRKFGGDLGIGNYAATVSRLKIMWTATCGVVEILGMVRKRKELLEVFCSEEQQSTAEGMGPCSFETDEHVPQTLNAPPPNPATMSAQERSTCTFEKRLDLAEYAAAIAESLKLWLEIVPWRVQVLYEGKELIPTLGAEEEVLPWPPDSKPSPGSEAGIVQAGGGVGVTGLGGEQLCELGDADRDSGDIDRDKG